MRAIPDSYRLFLARGAGQSSLSPTTATMKPLLLFACMILLGRSAATAQTVCNSSGNLIIFSNYDGGTLNINVDVNIPNLKIGVVSYEAVAINISGTFAGNVTGVRYAGYNNTPNNNCTPNITTTTITGA